MKNNIRRITSLILAISVSASMLTACSKKVNKAVDLSVYLSEISDENTNGAITYSNYIKNYELITINAKIEVITEKSECVTGNTQVLQFSVMEAGLYRLCAKIKGGKDTLADYYGSLKIDGNYPFYECEQIYFSKKWINNNEFDIKNQPELLEDEEYISLARSEKSYTAGELYFYLEKGAHSLEFTPENQNVEFLSLYFEGYKSTDLVTGTPKTNNADAIIVQAENPDSRSKSSILEQIDRTSAATVPVCRDRATYNTLGGNSWSKLGESISWKIPVEKDGWYSINLRVRQDYSVGAVSCRRILVDGKELTENMPDIKVPYSASWQRLTVSDENNKPIYLYLTKGEHTITMECSLGSLKDVVPIVKNSVNECNRIYRRIIMITGTNPDLYRDYNLDEKLADVIKDIKHQRDTLNDVADYLSYLSDSGESDAAVFRKLVRQFDEFLKDSDNIQSQINTLNSNISAIGTWLLECTSQPLEIDWIELLPYGKEAKKINANFFKQLWHDVVRIFKTYYESYNVINQTKTDKYVDVWVVTGREQIQIIESLANNDFTKQNNIGVRLKLVSGDSIMAATVANIGPDVTLFNGAPNVISYAVRSATVDLSKLDGFDETIKDFYPSALEPYYLQGGVYALPESQSFPMLFYRKDILKELELEVPTTWDEVYDCITTLQKNNMTFGCPTYDVFLYQNDGAYYNQKRTLSLLDSEESVKAFKTWTKFYTNFNLPLSYNFINRFRSGEMPVAIADYSSYNSLVVFAPEISGNWGMTAVPGTVKPDGSVDHSVNTSGTGAMIFSKSDDVESSWRFLKWWVSGKTQGDYATKLETKLGASARVMVASKTAFERLDWTNEQATAIKNQWQWTVGTPEVPGGYLMTRHINNIFRKVVYQGEDLRETVGEYKNIVDKELALKREEYGLK